MAKELPYFKFYIGEWSNGDITLEDYEAQGLFVNICTYYWFKECQLTLSALNKKFRSHEHIILNLIDLNIIKKIGDNISISFLNEQFSSKEVQKAVNRNNGKLGGRPIGKKTETKPNRLIFANRNETETKPKHNQYKEEKIREDNIKVKFSIPTNIEIEDYFKELNHPEKMQKFLNHYSANGWMVGKNKMKDWKAAARNSLDWNTGYTNGTNTLPKQQEVYIPPTTSRR